MPSQIYTAPLLLPTHGLPAIYHQVAAFMYRINRICSGFQRSLIPAGWFGGKQKRDVGFLSFITEKYIWIPRIKTLWWDVGGGKKWRTFNVHKKLKSSFIIYNNRWAFWHVAGMDALGTLSLSRGRGAFVLLWSDGVILFCWLFKLAPPQGCLSGEKLKLGESQDGIKMCSGSGTLWIWPASYKLSGFPSPPWLRKGRIDEKLTSTPWKSKFHLELSLF